MKKTRLFWLQCGACGGDSMALLSAAHPSLEYLVVESQLELLWHPSLSPTQFETQLEAVLHDEQPLDLLCIEGSIVTAPNGTGMFDCYRDRSKLSIVEALAAKARYVLAMGTCAAFGGIHAAPPNPSDCIGLQFEGAIPGGLFAPEWRSQGGLPVINLAGCPCHPETMAQTIAMLVEGLPFELDHLNRPKPFFSTLVHQGCSRNEYHEYDIEETEIGTNGCMFFNLGCQGPLASAICNTELWNGRNSKTRAGVPCFGCTSPSFPLDQELFKTEKIGTIPARLPLGVDRAHYLAYKSLAHEAAPERVRKREMEP